VEVEADLGQGATGAVPGVPLEEYGRRPLPGHRFDGRSIPPEGTEVADDLELGHEALDESRPTMYA
jgi:hypothetical protein